MNKTSRLKKILFLIFAVAVNVAGGKLVEAFYVPLYMDSVLTIAVAVNVAGGEMTALNKSLAMSLLMNALVFL